MGSEGKGRQRKRREQTKTNNELDDLRIHIITLEKNNYPTNGLFPWELLLWEAGKTFQFKQNNRNVQPIK